MSESNLYYIYIDTRIDGALVQLISYFQTGVFNKNQCISVYCKYYKGIEKKFSREFYSNNINFKFIKKNSDIKFEDNKVVFYLFNAQSNCRIVAHRNVSHIFVTHGESHKVSSIKPIVRIYDHVVTSGQIGIDRYLKAGIFTENDVLNKRIIRLGNTFIGQNYYYYSEKSRTLLYAPTWEGGVPNENYSSISLEISDLLVNYIHELSIDRVIIQPHPNLGHRDGKYLMYLNYIATALVKQNIKVVFRKKNLSFFDRFKKTPYCYEENTKACGICYAITDISAMEVQLITKKIPVTVFVSEIIYHNIVLPKKVYKYYNSIVNLIDLNRKLNITDVNTEYLAYVESYDQENLKILSWAERIEWLCIFANKIRCEKVLECYSKY